MKLNINLQFVTREKLFQQWKAPISLVYKKSVNAVIAPV
jgi:hypothetical protein